MFIRFAVNIMNYLQQFCCIKIKNLLTSNLKLLLSKLKC